MADDPKTEEVDVDKNDLEALLTEAFELDAVKAVVDKAGDGPVRAALTEVFTMMLDPDDDEDDPAAAPADKPVT